MVAFGLMAYQYYNRHKAIAAVVFGVLTLLFQPIYKIALGRVTWNVIDVLVAVLLIALFVLEKRLEKNNGGLSAAAATRPCANRRQYHRVQTQW